MLAGVVVQDLHTTRKVGGEPLNLARPVRQPYHSPRLIATHRYCALTYASQTPSPILEPPRNGCCHSVRGRHGPRPSARPTGPRPSEAGPYRWRDPAVMPLPTRVGLAAYTLMYRRCVFSTGKGSRGSSGGMGRPSRHTTVVWWASSIRSRCPTSSFKANCRQRQHPVPLQKSCHFPIGELPTEFRHERFDGGRTSTLGQPLRCTPRQGVPLTSRTVIVRVPHSGLSHQDTQRPHPTT